MRTLVFVAVAVFVTSQSSLRAEEIPSLESLQKLAIDLLDNEGIKTTPPALQIRNNKASVVIPMIYDPIGDSAQDLELTHLLLERIMKVELYRRHLFSSDDDKKFMKPFFDAEQARIKVVYALAKRHDGTVDQFREKLIQLKLDTYQSIEKGVTAWCKRRGLEFQGRVAAARTPTEKTLLAERGAQIQVCYNTIARIAMMSGNTATDEAIPWKEYRHGDKVAIGGVVRFRITVRGKTKTFVRDVPFDGNTITLPTP